jgi:hypothetical protein
MVSERPEIHAALSLAERHRQSVEFWTWRSTTWRRRRFIAKHQSKIQKHMARAARLADTGRAG